MEEVDMSVWRRKAIDCLPEMKKELEQPETNIYPVFMELLPATVEAHKNKDHKKLSKYYAFAEWCFRQKEKELWNAAAVSFYEHLADHEEALIAMPVWVKKDIYEKVRVLLEHFSDEEKVKWLDIQYYGKKKPANR